MKSAAEATCCEFFSCEKNICDFLERNTNKNCESEKRKISGKEKIIIIM